MREQLRGLARNVKRRHGLSLTAKSATGSLSNPFCPRTAKLSLEGQRFCFVNFSLRTPGEDAGTRSWDN